jgi:hypothetical protein
MHKTTITPVVAPVAVPGGWKIRCPYCNGSHLHSPGEGTRLAHCGDGGREYYLRPMLETRAFLPPGATR